MDWNHLLWIFFKKNFSRYYLALPRCIGRCKVNWFEFVFFPGKTNEDWRCKRWTIDFFVRFGAISTDLELCKVKQNMCAVKRQRRCNFNYRTDFVRFYLLAHPGLRISVGLIFEYSSPCWIGWLFPEGFCIGLDILFPIPNIRSLFKSAIRGIDIA